MGQRGIVITGSTRGLGYALAKEFLRLGCSVMVSGRSAAAVDGALTSLKEAIPNASVFGFPCDVRSSLEVDALWTEAAKQLGRIDHWINNAGIGQPTKRIWELDPDTVDDVIGTDLSGILNGARTAMRGMIAQKGGAIWFMEGHGSDGRILSGLSVYGAAKRALRYVAEALAVEARGTDVVVGALSPGIMITDFTMSQIERAEPQQR
ncbi:MAG TPA: SDR family oxidoreductase, partial [Spirochaetia bacterium]|nr:SDR family oxidoreductase [Spirochaetia bacterium]